MSDQQPEAFFPNLDAMDLVDLDVLAIQLSNLTSAVHERSLAWRARLAGHVAEAQTRERLADELLKNAPPWAKW